MLVFASQAVVRKTRGQCGTLFSAAIYCSIVQHSAMQCVVYCSVAWYNRVWCCALFRVVLPSRREQTRASSSRRIVGEITLASLLYTASLGALSCHNKSFCYCFCLWWWCWWWYRWQRWHSSWDWKRWMLFKISLSWTMQMQYENIGILDQGKRHVLERCDVRWSYLQWCVVWCGTVCTQRGQAFIVSDLPVAKRDDVRELWIILIDHCTEECGAVM